MAGKDKRAGLEHRLLKKNYYLNASERLHSVPAGTFGLYVFFPELSN